MFRRAEAGRRLAVESAVSLLIWAALWVPGVHTAYSMGRTQKLPIHPDLPIFMAVRYLIFAILSVALFEYATAIPFRKGNRIKASLAHLAGFPMFIVLYGVMRTMALIWIHRFPGEFSNLLAVQLQGQVSSLFIEQLWAYVAVVIVAHAVMNQRAARQRELQAVELRAELARQQLQILKLQLHPHFLFNALHGISSLMDTDIELARTSMARFSDLIRIALSRSAVDEIALREELDFVESYVALEKLRLGERLAVSIEAPHELRDAMVPAMVLQPLIENAIRHGVERRRGRGVVDVSVWIAGQRLNMRVTNDMVRGKPSGSGIGLRNTRGRLHALYGDEHHLEAGCLSDDKYQVILTMPLRKAS
jgi:sensor histidine kinase YesM